MFPLASVHVALLESTPSIQVQTSRLPFSSHKVPSSLAFPLLSRHTFLSVSTNTGLLPQNLLLQPGTPDSKHLHWLQSSFQLSPAVRVTPCSSTPQLAFSLVFISPIPGFKVVASFSGTGWRDVH